VSRNGDAATGSVTMVALRIGIHTSIAGGLDKAALRAAELGANTFQIFSTSPRMWKSGPVDAQAAARIKEARERLDLTPLVVHDNYLINMAAADAAQRKRSVEAFRGEIERCLVMGAEYLVLHPGSYKGQSVEQGIAMLADSLVEAARGLGSKHLMLLLENTAGSGSALGSRFEELAAIRDAAQSKMDLAIGYCLDTAHCLAAGYDVASEGGLARTVREAQTVLGLESVRVIHTNDSKAPLGARVDRHEHIGQGYIGIQGFRRILQHPRLRDKAFILETPIDREGDDRRNLQKLKRLCPKSRTTTNRSS
jgi:deoxyribonuclease IV